jgi:hypothetical protein
MALLDATTLDATTLDAPVHSPTPHSSTPHSSTVHSSTSGSPGAGPRPGRLHVETVLLSVRCGRLYHRTRAHRLRDGEHPDVVARRLAGFAHPGESSPPGGRLLHSTSWRYEDSGVVLTYVALPDPEPGRGAQPLPHRAPYATDPLAPALSGLTAGDVAVHAVRHLAYLRRTDPLVAATAAAAPELWSLIDELDPALAGRRVDPVGLVA